LFLLIAAGACSCSITKFVPEGEYLLDKVKIESDVPGYNSYDLNPYVKQQPNFRMFILGKTTLGIYNWSGKDNDLWINRLLKKIGDEPVIFDSTLVRKTNKEFEKLFINKGYMNVEVESSVFKQNKKARVKYSIKGNTPYRIRDYNFSIEDDSVAETLKNAHNDPRIKYFGEPVTIKNPFVKSGMLFDRNLLDAERDRLTTLLRNRGYYAFTKENIDYEAHIDSSSMSIDLLLRLHLMPEILPNGNYLEIPHRKYFYDKVRIYLDYDPLKYTDIEQYPKNDSIDVNGYTIFFQGKKPALRPGTLINNCFITPSRFYSQLKEENTYSALTLNTLNNIHIQYTEKFRNDSSLLDCDILAMTAKKQSVSFSVEGTNTVGNLGVASSVNYTHRNLFRGAEALNFKVRGAYEYISDLTNPYVELGSEASFVIPKFVFPFISRNFLRTMRTSTSFSASYNYQTRPEYDRTLLSGGIRYSWQKRNRLAARHQFDLIDIDYVYLPRKDSIFMNNLPSGAKYFGYTDQFIVGINYTYYNSTFDPLQKQRNAQSIRFSLGSAGNVLQAASNLLHAKKDEYGSYRLFGTYFAQFVRANFDYSATQVLDKYNSVAWRIGGGVGIPYGNSEILPFEKRYYSGGANSVRAWTVRELGPGGYVPVDTTTFFNQSGDIKLDLNIEYRTRFFWRLETAVFIDAGNIWTVKDYAGQKNGKFKLDAFYKQIAVGYGVGLRLDYDFFLVRFDCGWKAYNPEKKGRDAWAILNPNFKGNWAWHIAIGYPF
jgi:hypothetical protein